MSGPAPPYRASRVTTKSAPPPQAEQRSRAAQPITVHCLATTVDQIGDVGLDPVAAALAPHD